MGLAGFAWRELCCRPTYSASWSAQWWRWHLSWCSTSSMGCSSRRCTCARPGPAPTPLTATCPDPQRRMSSSSSCWWWPECRCCSLCWSSTTSAGRACGDAHATRRSRETTTEPWPWPCLQPWSQTAHLGLQCPAPHPQTSISAWQPQALWTPWTPLPLIPLTTGWRCSRTLSTWPPSSITAATTWRMRKTSCGWDTPKHPQSCPTAAHHPLWCTPASWGTSAAWARPVGAAAGLAKMTWLCRLKVRGAGWQRGEEHGAGPSEPQNRDTEAKRKFSERSNQNTREVFKLWHWNPTHDHRGWTKCSKHWQSNCKKKQNF